MLTQIILLLAGTAADLLTLALLARFALQAARAPFRNPLGQFLLAATNWMVLPVRRLIPSAFGYDSASLLLAWLWQALLLTLTVTLGIGLAGAALFSPLGIVLAGALEVVKLAIYLLIGIVLLSAIFSWVNPHAPLAGTVNQLVDPLLRPFRRWIPLLGGIDLSPIALLLVLQVALIVLASLRSAVLTAL